MSQAGIHYPTQKWPSQEAGEKKGWMGNTPFFLSAGGLEKPPLSAAPVWAPRREADGISSQGRLLHTLALRVAKGSRKEGEGKEAGQKEEGQEGTEG